MSAPTDEHEAALQTIIRLKTLAKGAYYAGYREGRQPTPAGTGGSGVNAAWERSTVRKAMDQS